MNHPNPLGIHLPIALEQPCRVPAVRDENLRAPENAPHHPSELTALPRDVQLLAVDKSGIGHPQEPPREPGHPSFRQQAPGVECASAAASNDSSYAREHAKIRLPPARS